MPARTLPGLGLTGFWDLGFDGWKDDNDANLRVLSVLVQARVMSRVTALPGSPSEGDRYIVPSGGNANQIAIRDNGAWVYLVPAEGYMAYIEDEDVFVFWTGSVWRQSGLYYDVNLFVSGTMKDAETLFRMKTVRAFSIPAALSGSYGDAAVAATGSTVLTLHKNGTPFGTLAWAATETAAVLVAASATSFAAGDVLSITGPTTADATLADIAICLKGRVS